MSCSFPFFRINSYVLIVQFFLPFQLFLSIRCVCAFVSTLLSCSFSSSFPFTLSISLCPSFRFNSSLLFVISFLSFQLSPHVSQKTWKECSSREKHFFQVFKGGAIRAGICRPSSHLRPLAATCPSGHLRPLAASCGHLQLGRKWLQVAASGCKWLQIMQMAASDAALEISNPTSRTTGHMRPRAATCGHLRPLALAATCGHLRPLEWLQVAAFLNFKYRAFCNLNALFP